jgi:hypothetical protein
MEIYRLKTELDSAQLTQSNLKETVSTKENEIVSLHERIIDVSATKIEDINRWLCNAFDLARTKDDRLGKGILHAQG